MDKEQIKQNFIEKLKADNFLFEVNYGNGEINQIKIEDAATVTVDFERDSDQRVFIRRIGYMSSTQFKCILEVLERVNKLLEILETEEEKNE